MKTKEECYVRENNCPYCGYKCECATSTINEGERPSPGDLSFCLMCIEASQFADDLSLVKFDLNSIDDIVERNRLKGMQVKMSMFWDAHPELQPRRDKVLNAKNSL